MRRACFVVLALVASVLSGTGGTAVSRADVPPSDRDRFVALWDARFHSQESFQAYLDSDAQYDDGFNGYPFEDKIALVDALVAYWEANEPGFADGIDYTVPPGDLPPTRPGEPDEEFADYLVDGALPTREMMVYLVYQFVFEKNAFKQRLRRETTGADAGLPDVPGSGSSEPPPTGRPATPLDEALTLIQSTLVDAENVYDEHRPVEFGSDIPDPEVTTPSFPATAQPRSGSSSSAFTKAGRARARPGIPRRFLLHEFKACAQKENSPSPTCDEGTLSPLPLGNCPPTYGLLANPVELLGGDVKVRLAVTSVLSNLNTVVGVSALLDVEAVSPVRAHVWVYYKAVSGAPWLRLGFGGSDNGSAPYVGIQERQTVSATVDLLSFAAVALDVESKVTQCGPASATTVAVEYGYAPSNSGPDTALARLTIANAPRTTTANVCHTLYEISIPLLSCVEPPQQPPPLGTSVTVVSVEHGVVSPTPLPDLGVHLVSTGPDKRTTAKATLPGLAKEVSVRLDNRSEMEHATIRYTALTAMKDVTGDVRVAETGIDPTYWHAAVAVASLPKSITVDLKPKLVTYDASDPITASAGGEDALVATYDQGIPGTPDTVYKSAELRVSNVPTDLAMTLPEDPNPQQPGALPPRIYTLTMGNDSGPHVIDSLTGWFYDFATSTDVHAVVRKVPLGTYKLQLPVTGHNEIVWSGPSIEEVSAWGRVGAWRFSATVLDTPTYWRLGLDDKSIVAVATAGAGSEITAWITNTTTILTPPSGYTNAVVGEVTLLPAFAVNPNAVLVSAAIHVVGLQHVAVTPGDPKLNAPSTFRLEAGAGGSFYVWVKVHNQTLTPARHGLLEAVVTSFPGTITGSTGPGVLDVTTSGHPTLQAYAEWGSAATLLLLPPVPFVHGLAARDAGPLWDIAVAVRVHLTGLPTHVHVEKGKILVTGFQPAVDRLQADIVLDSHPTKVVVAYADLQNIPTGAASTFDIAYTVTKGTSKEQTITAKITASAPMGPLYVLAGGATYAAFAQVSNVPASLELEAHDAEGKSDITWKASQRIASAWAAFQVRGTLNSPFVARGALHLEQIPREWSLKVGRDPNGKGPTYDYGASDPVDLNQRLDVTVVADGTLASASAVVAASLYFEFVDFGSSSALVQSPAGPTIAPLPERLTRVTAIVSALVKANFSAGSPMPTDGWIQLGYGVDVLVESVAALLTVRVEDVSSLTIEPGISARLSGDFSAFKIGWAGLLAKGHAHAGVGVLVKIVKWWRIGIVDIAVFTGYLPVALHAYRTGEFETVTFPIGWTGRNLVVIVRPKPYAVATSGLGMTLSGTPGSQATYYLTPNPLWPGNVLFTNILTALRWDNGTIKLRVT